MTRKLCDDIECKKISETLCRHKLSRFFFLDSRPLQSMECIIIRSLVCINIINHILFSKISNMLCDHEKGDNCFQFFMVTSSVLFWLALFIWLEIPGNNESWIQVVNLQNARILNVKHLYCILFVLES
jgi:hypothetical protein